MMAQERFPALPIRSSPANGPHLLLDGSFAHANIQLEQFSPEYAPLTRRRFFAAISLIKQIVWGESFDFLAHAFVLRFQNRRKSSRWKPQERLWLDQEECLFPGSGHPGKKHQEKPIRLPIGRSLDLSTENDQLLP
jgi:hypothetical protein